VLALRRSHPDAPPLDLLELVFGPHRGQDLDFSDDGAPGGDWTSLKSHLAPVLVEAFDTVMTIDEWRRLEDHGVDEAWGASVLEAFGRRFQLWGLEREPVRRVRLRFRGA